MSNVFPEKMLTYGEAMNSDGGANISRERLHQIALRKLQQLSVSARPSPDGQRLEGEIHFQTARIKLASGEMLSKVPFFVHGHDRMELKGPLSGTEPILFLDVDSRAALETRISVVAQKKSPALVPPAPASAPAGPAAAPRTTSAEMTLSTLAHKFGASANLSPTSALELWGEVQVGNEKLKWIATRDASGNFTAALSGSAGVRFRESFSLQDFAGISSWLSKAMSSPPMPAAPTPAAAPPPSPPAATSAQKSPSPQQLLQLPPPEPGVPHLLAPQKGEVWVMNVLVEQETSEEVRYVCVDTDGKPYGASRVLKRVDFDSAFVRHGTFVRLLIYIDTVDGAFVVYQQLDSQRQPRGTSKRLATAILVTNFIPEAAAY